MKTTLKKRGPQIVLPRPWAGRRSATPMLIRILLPAYSIETSDMRPVTKISVFGLRLGIAVLIVYWLTLFVGTHLPAVPSFTPNVNDKAQHFGAFFLLGLLLCYVTNSPDWIKRFGTIALVGISYAAIDEWTQLFIPGRHADIYDFATDAAALLAAIAVYVVAKLAYRESTRDR